MPPKSKSKGKAKAKATQSQSKAKASPTMTVNQVAARHADQATLDRQGAEALLGYGMMRIKISKASPEPAVKLEFGKRNDRKLRLEEVRKIRDTYNTSGYQNEEVVNAIPVLVDPTWFEGADFVVAPLPNVELPKIQLKRQFWDVVIKALTGQHRLRAALDFVVELEAEQTDLEKKVDKGRKARTPPPLEKLAAEALTLERNQATIERCRYWVFVFYDQNRTGTELEQHLSRNETKHVYKETAEERLVQLVRQILEARGTPQWENVCEKTFEAARSTRFSNIFQAEHTRSVLLCMVDFVPYYRHSEIMSTRWLSGALLGVHGGILASFICEGINTIKSLFSSFPLLSTFDAHLITDGWNKTLPGIFKDIASLPAHSPEGVEARAEYSTYLEEYDEVLMAYWSGDVHDTLITVDLMIAIDDAAKRCFGTIPWALGQNIPIYRDQLRAYITEVQCIVALESVKWRSPEEKLVADNVLSRIYWQLTYVEERACPLPFMTEWVIMTLNENLGCVPEAIKEVSRWFSPLVDHILIQQRSHLHDYSAYISAMLQSRNPTNPSNAPFAVICEGLVHMLWTHLAPMNAYILGMDNRFSRVTNKDAFEEVFGAITKEHLGVQKNKVMPFVVSDDEIDLAMDAPPGKQTDPLQAVFLHYGWKKIRRAFIQTAIVIRDNEGGGEITRLIMDTPWIIPNTEKNYSRILPLVGAGAAELAYIPRYRPRLLKKSMAGFLRLELETALEPFSAERIIQVGQNTITVKSFNWSDDLTFQCTAKSRPTVEEGYTAFQLEKVIQDAAVAVQKLLRPIENSPYALIDGSKRGRVASEVATGVTKLIMGFEINAHRRRQREQDPDIRVSKNSRIPRINLARMRSKVDENTSDFSDRDWNDSDDEDSDRDDDQEGAPVINPELDNGDDGVPTPQPQYDNGASSPQLEHNTDDGASVEPDNKATGGAAAHSHLNSTVHVHGIEAMAEHPRLEVNVRAQAQVTAAPATPSRPDADVRVQVLKPAATHLRPDVNVPAQIPVPPLLLRPAPEVQMTRFPGIQEYSNADAGQSGSQMSTDVVRPLSQNMDIDLADQEPPEDGRLTLRTAALTRTSTSLVSGSMLAVASGSQNVADQNLDNPFDPDFMHVEESVSTGKGKGKSKAKLPACSKGNRKRGPSSPG
ncbi:hypothetical protein Hypma_010433 [Hypsizygus marmoreus]|uniref:Uncharacterized protein n=1 Tax=Hypsizygus marmoreus TaxID=39966 RepID=A0A369K9G9_HYPMA|nr:hypothetical protein Hypma_010433 [Hypsizygus marmoreus]